MRLKIPPYQKPILISLSPNTEKDDIALAINLMLKPWQWRGNNKFQNPNAKTLEQTFRKYLGVKHVFAFNSGRAALLAILQALAFKKGGEILIQGFTCNGLVNPLIWSGLKPVYVDIDEKTLNINPKDLQRKITPRSKAVIVQHTFGMPAFAKASAGKPADVLEDNKVVEIYQRHNLILIEDCAHALGASYHGKKLGAFGKAAFFSLGRDKVISSVFGGLAVTNDDDLAKKIGEYRDSLPEPSYCWIFQQLLHPILTNFLIIPLYGFWGVGKWVLLFLQKTHVLSKAVTLKEKKGRKPAGLAQRMPEPLAKLALNQFKKLEKFNLHRDKIAQIYHHQLGKTALVLTQKQVGRIYLRYPVLVRNHDTDKILRGARQQKIFLNDGWRKAVIVPPDTNQEKMGYLSDTCPVAEKVSQRIVNLPTHIKIAEKDARKIANFIKRYIS